MRLSRVLLAVILVLTVRCGMAQNVGSISGLVKDEAGKPLAGVPLTLSIDSSATPADFPAHLTTDGKGEFRFSSLGFRSYHLSTDQAGMTLAPPSTITLTSADLDVRLDLTLTRVTAGSLSTDGAGRQGGAFPPVGSQAAAPALNLQAAGIRGYIDPGGYSAPAGAAAATDLVRGISDLKRADNEANPHAGLSCSMQAGLLKTLSEHPADAHANLQLGQIYLAHHQWSLALPYLQRAWALDGASPETRASLADALLQSSQFQAAHDLLLKNAGSTDTAEFHRMLARTDEGLGRFTEASREYQAAATLQPSEENLFGAGYELILAGAPDAANKVFQAGAAQFSNSTILLMGIGTAAFLQGHSAEATHSFLLAASLNPSDPRPYPFLSASSSISGVEEGAVRAGFRKFYELDPENSQAAYFYAESLSHTSRGNAVDSDQIEVLLKKAVRLDPQFAKAHFLLGSLYFEHLKYTSAITEFETALRLDPELSEAHYKLSAAYRRAGQTEQADREMHLFVVHKARKTTAQGSDLNIEQFLSVFNKPERAAAEQTACVIKQ